ncbi:unnamed protein product [Brachionus calyciflorus]|uniref:Uncharacterized protein n=1 Tax=Brachionus calyciflorus TaxID=104777 RepID=A0A814I926_9BILA|nr:unnamed protein product [Brachionus calyciflorus]
MSFDQIIASISVGAGLGLISGGITGSLGYQPIGAYCGAITGGLASGYLTSNIVPESLSFGLSLGSFFGALCAEYAERSAYYRKRNK